MAIDDRARDDDAEDSPPARTPFLTWPQWALFGGLVFVVITLSVAITLMLFQPSTQVARDTQGHLIAQIEALESRMQIYERDLQRLQNAQESATASGLPPALRDRLIQQEESLRRFIRTLQMGMRDLARMVHGSRDWLELYMEELDGAIRESEQRQNALESQ